MVSWYRSLFNPHNGSTLHATKRKHGYVYSSHVLSPSGLDSARAKLQPGVDHPHA